MKSILLENIFKTSNLIYIIYVLYFIINIICSQNKCIRIGFKLIDKATFFKNKIDISRKII